MPRKAKIPTRYFGELEIPKLLGATRPKAERHLAMKIGMATGMRVGEMVVVRVEDFREVSPGWVCEVRDSKKRGFRRKVPVGAELVDAVRSFARDRKLKPRDLLFDVNPKTLDRWVKEAATMAGIQWDSTQERLRWHSFRGSFVRRHSDKSPKWLEQVTGDDWETLRFYYTDLSDSDLVRIFIGEPTTGGARKEARP